MAQAEVVFREVEQRWFRELMAVGGLSDAAVAMWIAVEACPRQRG